MGTISLQRSKKLLQDQGFDCWIVEKPYNQWTKRREDLFNFADLVGIRADCNGVTAIQATGEDVQSHVHKILTGFRDKSGKEIPPNAYVKTWLLAGNRLFIWAWRKRGERGKRKTWELREVEFQLKEGEVICVENSVKPCS